MKKTIPVAVFALFIQGCGNTIAEQVEDIKWIDNYSKLGKTEAYTQFSGGEVRSCTKKTGEWQTIARYEINQATLILYPEGKQDKKISYAISFNGKGKEKTLLLGIDNKTMEFPVATSADCPLQAS